MNRVFFFLSTLLVTLAACSAIPTTGPSGDQVIADSHGPGYPRFDIVRIDDRVLGTLAAQPTIPFHSRFPKYTPPPELPIEVGDVVSVVIWEAAGNGLFGRSLSATTATGSELVDRLRAAGVALPVGPISSGQLSSTLARLRNTAEGQSTLQSLQPTGRSGTSIPDQQVGPDGAITIPYAGRIPVVGLTPTAVGHLIARRLAQKAIEPQLLVVVKSSDVNSVAVSGDLIKGARVTLSEGGTTLMQAIAAAGGTTAPVHDTYVELSRDGITAVIPLAALVADPDEDIFARPGDVITVERKPRVVSVFGATTINRAVTFDRENVSLIEALGRAGGLLDQNADPRAIFLMRYEPARLVKALGEPPVPGAPPGVEPVAYQLDLYNAKSYALAKRFLLHDNDVIYVANAKIMPVQKVFTVFENLTAPAISGYLTCRSIKC